MSDDKSDSKVTITLQKSLLITLIGVFVGLGGGVGSVTLFGGGEQYLTKAAFYEWKLDHDASPHEGTKHYVDQQVRTGVDKARALAKEDREHDLDGLKGYLDLKFEHLQKEIQDLKRPNSGR